MTLTVGQKVYYPGRGPYLVSDVVRKVVCGASLERLERLRLRLRALV